MTEVPSLPSAEPLPMTFPMEFFKKKTGKEEAKKLDRRGKYMYRIDGLSWWKEELPSDKEMQNGLENLEKTGNRVDYIITHSPPASIIALLGFGAYKQDILTEYLEDIRCTIDYNYWFMGHMHMNGRFTKQDFLLYEQIVRGGVEEKKAGKNAKR